MKILHAAICAMLCVSTTIACAGSDAARAKVTVVLDKELPNIPGKSMRSVLVEYGPGDSTPSHRHPKSAFIFVTVLEGAVRNQINDEPVRIYKAGESFTEMPGDRHSLNANASDTEPAKFMAVFIVDTAERDLVLPE